MAQITYTNKVALNENPEIAAINKVTDDDMNEIKSVVNANYNNTIQITDTEPTDNDNKIWIDTGEIGSQVSEITNNYSTSTGLGSSASYLNNKIIVESGSNEGKNYIKYGDGTLICTIRKTVNVAINITWGNLYVGDTNIKYTYPVAFVGNAPVVNCSITGYNSAFVISWIQSSNNLVETDRYALVRGNTASAQDYVLNITAIGRWK